jgi:hypothetical protein
MNIEKARNARWKEGACVALKLARIFATWWLLASALVVVEAAALFRVVALLAWHLYGGLPHDVPAQIAASLPLEVEYAIAVVRVWVPIALLPLAIDSKKVVPDGPARFTARAVGLLGTAAVCGLYYYWPQFGRVFDARTFGSANADSLGYVAPASIAFLIVSLVGRQRIVAYGSMSDRPSHLDKL